MSTCRYAYYVYYCHRTRWHTHIICTYTCIRESGFPGRCKRGSRGRDELSAARAICASERDRTDAGVIGTKGIYTTHTILQ